MRKRKERSGVVFPYGSLNDALSVVDVICSTDSKEVPLGQLAARMRLGRDSGPFRIKFATAKIFGLVSREKKGAVLTDLARELRDPQREANARAKAFVRVPLFRKIFETYQSKRLPDDAQLEEDLRSWGVPLRQRTRARQSFQRSGQQAGVMTESKDRLIVPPEVVSSSMKLAKGLPQKIETDAATSAQLPRSVPFLLEPLFKSLPTPGTGWPRDARQQWMTTLERALDSLYETISA